MEVPGSCTPSFGLLIGLVAIIGELVVLEYEPTLLPVLDFVALFVQPSSARDFFRYRGRCRLV
mgnify:CR=1 FL=1